MKIFNFKQIHMKIKIATYIINLYKEYFLVKMKWSDEVILIMLQMQTTMNNIIVPFGILRYMNNVLHKLIIIH